MNHSSHPYPLGRTHLERRCKGFSLIELMIAVTISTILSSIIVPTLHHYSQRAHYTELVQATVPYKLGVSECYQDNGDLDDCNSGQNNIPDEYHTHLIDHVNVQQGVIDVVPKPIDGFKSDDDYQLTPQIVEDHLEWQSGGGGVKKGYTR